MWYIVCVLFFFPVPLQSSHGKGKGIWCSCSVFDKLKYYEDKNLFRNHLAGIAKLLKYVMKKINENRDMDPWLARFICI